MRGETRRNVAASVRQFANSRHVCSAKIYDTLEIFHYRFSWTSRPAHMYSGVIYVLTYHITHLAYVQRVSARTRSNSSHVSVINAITYKLWRELEPHDDLSRVFAFSVPRPFSLSPLFFLSLFIYLSIHISFSLKRLLKCRGQWRVSKTRRLQAVSWKFRESPAIHVDLCES